MAPPPTKGAESAATAAATTTAVAATVGTTNNKRSRFCSCSSNSNNSTCSSNNSNNNTCSSNSNNSRFLPSFPAMPLPLPVRALRLPRLPPLPLPAPGHQLLQRGRLCRGLRRPRSDNAVLAGCRVLVGRCRFRAHRKIGGKGKRVSDFSSCDCL